MHLINPFVDTNIIISNLYKYEPDYSLTKDIFKYQVYYSENVDKEVKYIFREKKEIIDNFI